MSAYERYAPFIQDFIYRSGWEDLRGIQTAAADAIFHTEENVLLSASTASGKTEAAFFPILTLFSEDPPSSVGAIYIGPLKALINDQFERLNALCEEEGIPVWHWHGDAPRSHKEKMMKNPSGILQITPESLEAMLLHRHSAISRLFGDLRFIVIDEIHSLLRSDRGAQTLCLIERLSRMAGVNPRRIGLSATIGDPEEAGRVLAHGTGRDTLIPRFEAPAQSWRLGVEHFYKAASEENGENGEKLNVDPGLGYIYRNTRGRKCLIFCNSREESEAVTSTLRHYCEEAGEPDRFLIHHGNLSAAYRLTAEDAMKDDDVLMSTVTTATLELGIDIGRLELAFQLDAPFTVSSFLQRMGRTGRRGQPQEMHFVVREDPPMERAMLPESLPWTLIQAISLIQLYVEEKWVEPPRPPKYPYSLLYHQTMSILASGGELTGAALAGRVLTLTPFRQISQEDYRVLLLHLIESDQIQRTERDGLIVGLAGERIINNYKFYAVFQENEEYTVRSDSQEIGTIVKPPPPGEKIAIAGLVWTVDEVDHKRHTVYCQPVKGTVPAYFGDCPGDIHTRILERMKQVLKEDKGYPYLSGNAKARLQQARDAARQARLLEEPLISLGGSLWALFPWLGSYAFLALERFIKLKCANRLGIKGLCPSRPYFMQFTMRSGREEFYRVLREEAEKQLDPMELVYENEVPIFDKYDEMLPKELIRKGFAFGVLDVEGMRQRVFGWGGGEG
ncbi:MAG: DEAD/DEAH box helicase [Lachnospiraceae bacterium]|nr:DEAD/DEAH box helicase [Lachnospiraceae bacterium]